MRARGRARVRRRTTTAAAKAARAPKARVALSQQSALSFIQDKGTGKAAGKDKGTGKVAAAAGASTAAWAVYELVKTARMHAGMLEDELQVIEDEMEAMPFL